MKKTAPLLLLVASTVLARCNGTETDNPLVEEPEPAWLSECKSSSVTAFTASSWLGATSQALEQVETTLPAALACVHWELDENLMLNVALNSFSGSCGTDFEAHSSLVDGVVTLAITNPLCRIAACGSCLYDSRFEIPLESSADRTFALVHHGCEGEETARVEWTLPLGTQPSGTICEFADGWGFSKVNDVAAGTEFGRCLEPTNTCEGDHLSCIAPDGGELGESNGLCVPNCQTDTDCPFSDVLECNAGTCMPRGR